MHGKPKPVGFGLRRAQAALIADVVRRMEEAVQSHQAVAQKLAADAERHATVLGTLTEAAVQLGVIPNSDRVIQIQRRNQVQQAQEQMFEAKRANQMLQQSFMQQQKM